MSANPVSLFKAETDYAGPHPVVAHPPCARWSVMAALVEAKHGLKRGDDGGCFASALASVRRWGGVLEHPARSAAWGAHGLNQPPARGWVSADFIGGWTCQVEQGHYGHLARKATWLYAIGVDLPDLRWGESDAECVFYGPSTEKPQRTRREMPKRLRAHTPPEFRDVLLGMARSAVAS